MASRPFINYPDPKEAHDVRKWPPNNNNPAVRGLALVATASLVQNVGFINRLLWNNTGFGRIKDLRGLDFEVATTNPRVIPTATSAEAQTQTILPFGPALTEPQHTHHKARYYSAADYHALYKAGTATPLDVVVALLPLVQRGQTPRSIYENAFLVTHVDELRAAAAASTARWAAGRPLGLLDGVPITVKCDIDVEGYVSTNGINPRPEDDAFGQRYPRLRRPAMETAWPVAKLLEAGALLVAQNNMHETGMDTTGCNPRNGTPVNWFNPGYYPGGSSSGGASGLGAGIVPIALGTDAGGSVRLPPSFNGVYGLKLTHDRSIVYDSSTCVIGPMAGTVADLTAAYRTMAQPNPEDPVTGKFAISQPPQKKGVLGIPREWIAKSDTAVVDHFARVVTHFQDVLGYDVVDIRIPCLSAGQAAHAPLCLAECLSKVRDLAQPSPNDWPGMLNAQNRILLTVAQHVSAVDYIKFNQLRTIIMRHLAHLWSVKHPGIIIVTPTAPDVGWPKHPGDAHHGFMDGDKTLRCMQFVWLANLTGAPSVTCPMGYIDPAPGSAYASQVPVGILATGEWGAEEQLLSFATDVEKFLHDVYEGGRQRPEKWVDVLALAEEEHAKAKTKAFDE